MPFECGIEDRNGWTALIQQEATDVMDVIEAHLPYEAGYRDHEGRTALMWAAQTGKQCYKLLAEYESDIVDNKGRKASDYAKEAGYDDIAKYLS